MSDAILDRIMSQISSLEDLTAKDSEASEKTQAPRTLQGGLSAFLKATGSLLVDYTEGEGESAVTYKVLPEDLITVIGADASNTIQAALQAFPTIVDNLNAITGSDRGAGDTLARGLTMACEQGWLEGEARVKAEQVVEAWNATAPKGSAKKGTGASTASDALPYPIRVTCEADGWSATESSTRNSLRWAWVKHHEAKHNHKPARGEALHKGVTEAITAVMEGANNAQGGGCLVDKA